VELTTPSVYEYEIAKHDDFQYGFESIIRNTAILDRMLVSAETDYIIGGRVTPDAESLGVRIGRIWGNGLALDIPVFNGTVSDVVPVAAAVSDRRFDCVQVRAVMEEYDTQRRAFFNPETEGGQYFMTPTRKRLKVECFIKQGTEGQDVAPPADEGWLKLAELLVEPEAVTFTEGDIRGVTAIYQGEENAEWTAEKKRTFDLGSTLELKTILAKEHTVTGEHREKVIKAVNIDFGTGAGQVNAKSVPLGEAITIGTDEFEALDSVYAALVKEVQFRRAKDRELAEAIAALDKAITGVGANDIQQFLAQMSLAENVRAASLDNINLAESAGVIDGVEIGDGDFVLLAGQTDKRENGIYIVQNAALVRASGFTDGMEQAFDDLYIPVSGGDVHAGKIFTVSTEEYAVGEDNVDFLETAFSFARLPGKIVIRDINGKTEIDTDITKLLAFREWSPVCHYNPLDPAFYDGMPYYANPEAPPSVVRASGAM
jgi:hypothetical protein